jgi:hypothetical protein
MTRFFASALLVAVLSCTVEATLVVTADPTMATVNDSVTFTTSPLTAQQIADNWTCRWKIDGTVAQGESGQTLTRQMTTSGIVIVRVEFLDAGGAVQDSGDLNYTVVDVQDIQGPDDVYYDTNGALTATFSATGDPPGGTYY